jgi:hypothetical protein
VEGNKRNREVCRREGKEQEKHKLPEFLAGFCE